MKLYELTKGINATSEMFENGEIDETTFKDTLDSLLPVAKEKGLNIAALFQNISSDVSAMLVARKRIDDRIASANNKVESLKKYLLENMIASNIDEISCPEFLIKLGKNPVKVVITCEAHELPGEFLKTKTTKTPDKKKLKEAIEAGGEIPHVTLERGKRLIVK